MSASRKTASMLEVNRDENPFVPSVFLGEGFDFFYGPDGHVEGDVRSLLLKRIDVSKITLESFLMPGETRAPGNELIDRSIQTFCIRADLGIFMVCWNNPYMFEQIFREKLHVKDAIGFFDGQLIRTPKGGRCTLGVGLRHGAFNWVLRRTGRMRESHHFSIVLPKPDTGVGWRNATD